MQHKFKSLDCRWDPKAAAARSRCSSAARGAIAALPVANAPTGNAPTGNDTNRVAVRKVADSIICRFAWNVFEGRRG
jgi:hypothetical protein